MAVNLSRGALAVLWVYVVPPAETDSERDPKKFVVYLQSLEDGFELRVTDFTHLWNKCYAASISGEQHQDLVELNEALAQGGAGVQVQMEITGSVTLQWCGTQAVLTSAGAVSTQELQPLVVHSVESMHASQRAITTLERKLEHRQVSSPLQVESTSVVKTGAGHKARRPPGQSMVNPLNKRRKAAGGVQFNDQ